MPYCAARCGMSSTFTFPTVAGPSNSTASSSIVGASTRHGPHHGAQKSTRTGYKLLRTSRGKFAALNVANLAFSMVIGCSLRCSRVIDTVSWRLRPCPDCHQRLSPIRRSGDGTSYLGTPFFWPRVGTLAARRSQRFQQAEKKLLSVSKERLAAFHHRGTLVTRASRGDHEGLTPVPSLS